MAGWGARAAESERKSHKDTYSNLGGLALSIVAWVFPSMTAWVRFVLVVIAAGLFLWPLWHSLRSSQTPWKLIWRGLASAVVLAGLVFGSAVIFGERSDEERLRQIVREAMAPVNKKVDDLASRPAAPSQQVPPVIPSAKEIADEVAKRTTELPAANQPPVLPEFVVIAKNGRTPFPAELVVTYGGPAVQPPSIRCVIPVLTTDRGVAFEDYYSSKALRVDDVSHPVTFQCAPPFREDQMGRVNMADIRVEIEFGVAGKPGRQLSAHTFSLSVDNLKLPVWVFRGSQTRDAPKDFVRP